MPMIRWLVAADPTVVGNVYKMWQYVCLDSNGMFRSSNKQEFRDNARADP